MRTDDCQVHHLGIVVSGQMHIGHRDGSEVDLNAGDVYDIEPAHDAWVLGDEPYVRVEFDDTTVATFGEADTQPPTRGPNVQRHPPSSH